MAIASTVVKGIFDNFRAQLPSAADNTLRLEYYNVLDEFLKNTNVWQEDILFYVRPGIQTYPIHTEFDAKIVRMLQLINSDERKVAGGMRVPGTVNLILDPSDDTYTATVALTVVEPTDDNYPYVPDWILDKYREAVTAGVLGRMMMQHSKPYSNDQKSIYHLRRFRVFMATARTESRHVNVYKTQAWAFPQSFTTRPVTQSIVREGPQAALAPVPVPLWTGNLGVSTSNVGFIHTWTENQYQIDVSYDRLKALKDAGFDFIRLPFNPEYLLAATTDTILASRWEMVDNAIAQILEVGLKVYLNNHIYTLGDANDWSAALVLAAYPTGTKWLRFLEVTAFIATSIKKYAPDKVCYGQFNEAPGVYAAWQDIAEAVYTKFRETNKDTTVFVSSDNYSGADSMITLNPTAFSGNVRFAFTPYEPQLFTHRRVSNTVPYDIPLNMNFPPIPSQKNSVLTDMQVNVLADTAISDKVAWTLTLQGYIGDYIDGRNGLEPTWLNRKLDAIVGWAQANHVPVGNLMISEIGVSTDSVQSEAPKNSNMRWFAGQRREALKRGIGGICIWDWSINGPFSINSTTGVLDDGYAVSVGGTPAASPSGRMNQLFTLQRSLGRKGLMTRTQNVMCAASDRMAMCGLWDKLALFYFWYNISQTEDQSLYSWKDPASNKLVVSGSPNFEVQRGWRSQGGSAAADSSGIDILNTGYICGDDSIYTRNDNHIGIIQNYGFADDDFTKFIAGDVHGRNYLSFSLSSCIFGLSCGSDFGGVTVSDSGLGTDALKTARKGHLIGTRSSSTDVNVYLDGSLVAGPVSNASGAFLASSSANSIRLLKSSRAELGGFHLGAKYTDQNVIDQYTIIDFMRVALDE